MQQVSPKPEVKPAKNNMADNALRLSGNAELDSQGKEPTGFLIPATLY